MQNTTRVTIKQCPFCGGKVNILSDIPHETLGQPGYAIECRDMGCILPRCGPMLRLSDIVEEWNTRAHGGPYQEETVRHCCT